MMRPYRSAGSCHTLTESRLSTPAPISASPPAYYTLASPLPLFRMNQERAAQLQANAQMMQRNQAKDLMGGIPYGDVATAPRRGAPPEMLPTAGRRGEMHE